MTPDEAGVGTDDARPLETDPTRFRRRFDQTSMPQSFCDLDGVLTEVNDAYCRLVDRPGSELVGMPVRSLNHRSDSGDADAHLAALLRGEIDSLQTERILCGPAGRPVPVLVDAALLRDEDGRPLGAAAFVQDLSSLRGAEPNTLCEVNRDWRNCTS